MDANFTFPARSKPTPRPSAAHSPTEPVNRESNALRASVLDAALELGFGANGAVANWMFNNALEEEDEGDEESDPIGKAPLSPTSDEYATYSTPPTSIESHSESFPPSVPSPLTSPDPNPAPMQVHFPEMASVPSVPAHSSSNKLRKQRRDGGYESDGGYVSDGGKKARARTKSKAKDSGPTSAPPISEPMELIPLTKEERKKKKKTGGMFSKDLETDTEDVPNPVKSKAPKVKKSKKSSTDAAAGYETDDGYVSSSGKAKSKGRSRFFSLRRKPDSTSEPAEVEPVPPMPEREREVFELPIASRFATTLGSNGEAPSTAPSRSETPLLPPSRPFASSASGSSTPSLSSSTNSLLTSSDRESFGAGSLSMNSGEMRSFKDDERNGHTPDNSFNSILTATQDDASSRSFSPQPLPNSKSKFLISYPVTRTGSGESAQNANPAKPKHVPNPISLSPHSPSGLNSRAPSPSPMGSPYVLLTPINTTVPSRAASPSPSGYNDIVPSGDFIVPSRSGSPMPPHRTPNPISGRASPNPMSGRASPNPMSGLASPMFPEAGMQRGRAAPFPTRPAQPRASAVMGPGLAARAKVQRYRDLYAIQIPATPIGARAPPSDDDQEADVNIRVEEWDSEGEGEGAEEILGVVGRFRAQEQGQREPRALERNNSGALRPGTTRGRLGPSSVGGAYSDDDEASRYPDEDKTAGRATMYRFDSGGGARDTMYSEYSRVSFMDVEKSDQARGQLVERVGAMFDLSGRERSAIPPVPKIPAALVGGGNRF
ncbi:hypothetical protein B0H17DRAFT_1078413 [Mycena rosella]|uniref:Uncharacterized protein n=1 Tax=Mycena rosella TaxID=1033263 RepID=A0AAD7GD54_MYCRO|nr:hypothetical protein B0H17DRAFT_1078413 [Mycena rosella]